MQCVVGKWKSTLDSEDTQAFDQAVNERSRADLYGFICAASAGKPFGLTALKQHINGKCYCNHGSTR